MAFGCEDASGRDRGRHDLQFTLLRSRFSVRVQVRFSVRGSWFAVRGSWFAVRGSAFDVRGSGERRTPNLGTPNAEPNVNTNGEGRIAKRELQSALCYVTRHATIHHIRSR